MTQNTTTKSLGKISSELFKTMCKHAGYPNMDLKDPKVQAWIKNKQQALDETAELRADKYFYINHLVRPFEYYSVFDDDSLRKANFKNYDPSFSAESKRNYQLALRIAKAYCYDKPFNTLLSGPCGRGKSHLALSILKFVLRNRKPFYSGVFMDVNEMMQKIKNSFDTHHSIKSAIQKRLANAYIIVLDDLGAEHVSNFDIEVLLGIFNSQHRIIMTTNLMPDEIRKTYGERIWSRMKRGIKGHVIQFTDATGDHREV